MFRRTWIARLFVVAAATGAAIAMSAGSANAGLLPVSVTVQPESGNFRWTYAVVLPTSMKLQSGSYFTVYDFAGYQAGTGGVLSAAPDESYSQYWTVTASKVGPTPDRLNPQDDPNVDNLTFMYNGPTVDATKPDGTGLGSLGNFIATSAYGDTADSFFTATNPRAADGQIDSNITTTLVPTGQPIPGPIGTPEPATLALAGLGLPLIGVARYIRRKKA
jgi:hypothetical protein